MRALVLGGRGMLGEAVMRSLARDGHRADDGGRTRIEDAGATGAAIALSRPDIVINCAGITETDVPSRYMLVNAYGARLVAEECEAAGLPLIHVSTDCVYGDLFVGVPWRRSAEDAAVPETAYARSKLAGEPNYGLIVRTSFVGPRKGLWAWAQARATEGGEIEGWANAWWSGSTVWAVADWLAAAAAGRWRLDDGLERGEIVNLATRVPISKATLLETLAVQLAWPLRVRPVATPEIDRSMQPSDGCELPPFADALREWVDA